MVDFLIIIIFLTCTLGANGETVSGTSDLRSPWGRLKWFRTRSVGKVRSAVSCLTRRTLQRWDKLTSWHSRSHLVAITTPSARYVHTRRWIIQRFCSACYLSFKNKKIKKILKLNYAEVCFNTVSSTWSESQVHYFKWCLWRWNGIL